MSLRVIIYSLIFIISFHSRLHARDISILFIGNSLTYSNNLPSILTEIGKSYDLNIATHSLCFPNYGLEDHWNEGNIQHVISEQDYDYVIFQQGPSSQAYGRSSLIEYGGKISKICQENDSKPVYFMVWPSLNYYYTFTGVIKNHQDAATMNNPAAS